MNKKLITLAAATVITTLAPGLASAGEIDELKQAMKQMQERLAQLETQQKEAPRPAATAPVLAELGAQVYTIERQKKLFDSNKLFPLLKKYPTIKFFYGDGYEGLPTFAPFDKVIITAAAPDVPPKLIEQMKVGGMMVIPVGAGDVQLMKRITKLEGGALKEEVFDRFSFVPMIEGKNS